MKRYNMNSSVKALTNMMDNDQINFECAVQRNKVWDIEKKTLLIHSILYGYTIPPFYLTKNEDGTYDSLDGKQRSNCLYEYLNDEFMLSAKMPIVYDNDGVEYEFAGKKFSELPEWAQDTIKDYMLEIFYYEDMSADEVREFFFRLNNGKPLTATELNRVKAKSIYQFQTIGKHDAIQYILTDKAKARFTHEQIAMQIYAMAYMDEPDFGSRAFRPYVQDVEVTEDEVAEFNTALDMLNECIHYVEARSKDEDDADMKVAKKILRNLKARTHFVAMSYLAYLYTTCSDEVSQDKFNDTVWYYYNTGTSKATVDGVYNSSIGAGSAKASAVQARKNSVETLYRSKLA